jgi:hypothetical protein
MAIASPLWWQQSLSLAAAIAPLPAIFDSSNFLLQLQQHIVSHVWLQQQRHLWQLLQPHSQPSFEKVTAQYKSFLAAAIMPFSTIFQSKRAPYLIAVLCASS